MTGITNAPLDRAHSWREVSTNMYARNYLEIDARPWYGRVDMAGEKTGITAKEFPVFNYLIFLTSKVFGYQHWYGRLINLIISSFGLWFFYLILAGYFNKRLAFTSTIILGVSIWFNYSRMIIPDTFSTSLVLIGTFYGLRFFKVGSIKSLILYGVFAGLGTLSKIPTIYMLGIFILPFFQKGTSWKTRLLFLIPSFFILATNAIWYGYWVPYVVSTYEYTHHKIKSFSQGLSEIPRYLTDIAYRFYGTALYSYLAFTFFVVGLVAAFFKKQRALLYPLAVLSILFALVIVKAGSTFSIHSYYIVPFVPVMALFAANGILLIKNKNIGFILLAAIAVEGVVNQFHHLGIDDELKEKLALEEIADSVSNKDDLFLAPYNENPILLYFAHRKGWTPKYETCKNQEWINSVIDKGAKFLLIDKDHAPDFLQNWEFEKVFENDYFLICSLHK